MSRLDLPPSQTGLTVDEVNDFVHWRVTHYDPQLREAGHDYGAASWISASDVGMAFGGVVLTSEAYAGVEDAHVRAVIAFADEAHVTALNVHHGDHRAPPDGTRIDTQAAAELVRRMLREEAWCCLESPEKDFYVHVGWDYYMYIGASRGCPNAAAAASAAGLFPERIDGSPHLSRPEDL